MSTGDRDSIRIDERNLSDGDAAAINDHMAARIEQRRLATPDRRQEAHDRRREWTPAEANKGRISARILPDIGSIFTVDLPRVLVPRGRRLVQTLRAKA